MSNELGSDDSAAAKKSRRRKWLLLAAKITIVLALVWGVRQTVVDGVEQLGKSSLTIAWGWLVVAGVTYALSNLPAAWFWWHSMASLDQRTGAYRALRAYVIGHLGKYVPGKALVVVLRAGFVRGPTCDAGVAAACVFLETLTMMASGAALAALVIVFTFPEQGWMTLLAIGLMAATFGPTWPPIFRFAVKRAGVGRRDPDIDRKLSGLVLRVVAVGWITTLLSWLLYGVSLWATLVAIGAMTYPFHEALLPVTATAALAVVAGFASLIPGGLGVRDLVLIEMLAPFLIAAGVEKVEAPALALAAAVLLRLVWLVAELAAAGIVYVIRPRIRPGERLQAC